MLTSIVKIKAKPGSEAAFEACFIELERATCANEPGAVFYRAYRGDLPGTYVILEVFKDEAALEAHRAAPHFVAARPRLAEFWEGVPEVQRLTELG